jgi:hypothetical protein
MALVGGIDYGEYGRWEKVVAPTGATYYKVPGTGYLYDPFLSNAKGRPVVFTDPRPEAAKLKKQEKMAEDAASPMGQLAPVAGAAVAPIAAKQVANWAFPTAAEKLAEAKAAKDLAALTASGAEVVPAQAAIQAGAQAGAAAAAGGAVPIQQLSTGGMLMSDGTIAGGGGAVQAINGASSAATNAPQGANFLGTATPYLGAAGAALGAYGLHNAIEANDPKAAFMSGAGLAGGLGMAAPLLGFTGPVGWGLLGLAALGGAGGLGLQQLLGQKSTKQIQAERWADVGHSDMNPIGGDYFAGTGGEKSRDEKFLTPDAIRNNPDNYHAAKDWDSWSRPQQDQFLSTMLAEGKVSERKGGIYYDDARAAELANQIRSGGAVAQPVTKSSAPPPARPPAPTEEEKIGAALANRMNYRSSRAAMR